MPVQDDQALAEAVRSKPVWREEDVADLLGTDVKAVQHLRRTGRIPAYHRLGRTCYLTPEQVLRLFRETRVAS